MLLSGTLNLSNLLLLDLVLFDDLQSFVVTGFNELKVLVVFLVDLCMELVFATSSSVHPLESVFFGVVLDAL